MTLHEYEYVALVEIWHEGVRAYNVGDPVPASNVTANGYEVGVQVAKRETKTADKAAEQSAETTEAQPVQQPTTQGPAAAAKKSSGGKASS